MLCVKLSRRSTILSKMRFYEKWRNQLIYANKNLCKSLDFLALYILYILYIYEFSSQKYAQQMHGPLSAISTGCNLGSEKCCLLGHDSLRLEGVQPKLRNLGHSQYIYRGVREWSGLCLTSADIYYMYYFENWLLSYGACVCVSVCVSNINVYVF